MMNYMVDELKETDRLKNDFISSVSHELRTPLTAIRGWSETLKAYVPEDEESKPFKQGIDIILKETGRLSDMVEDLLDFSKMENGKFTISCDKIDILAELEDAIVFFYERAKNENKLILYNHPESVLPVFGDKNRIRQVFINIIDNAMKYSESGKSIKINAYEQNGMAVIDIADMGCGISASDLPKVKERFYKANTSVRGSGIGLAISNEIISMHSGTLEIRSKVGIGTTVRIVLPVMQTDTKGELQIGTV